MTVVNPKSISGITSITTASGGDDILTIHNNNGTERLRIDSTGTTKIVTGIVTTLTATTGIVTTLTTNTLTANSTAKVGSGVTLSPDGDVFVTGVTTSSTVKVGGGVTISESGIEASGIGITCASINETFIGGRRNLIINGSHQVAQRGTAAVTVTTSAGFRCVDRYKTDIDGSGGGDFSHAQSTDVPAGQGFINSSKITVVTQASQPSSESNRHQLYYQSEKQDVTYLEWGTSSAKTCTLSFWVKASVAGIYPLWFQHYSSGGNKYYFTNYTINATNTWEKKSITLTGSTSGGNVSGTNAVGFRIEWGLGYGSDAETGTLNEWTTSSTIRAASNTVYLPENSGATFYLTGCQFEVGSQATPFEHRSFGEELALCQRYYETNDPLTTAKNTNGSISSQWSYMGANDGQTLLLSTGVIYKAVKRANPTVTLYNPSDTSTANRADVQGVERTVTAVYGSATAATRIYVTGGSTGNYVTFNWEAESEL